MTDKDEAGTGPEAGESRGAHERVFLVVVDETEEMHHALRYACRRAHHTGGRVNLLYVVEPSEFEHWMTVGDLMREEARNEAERVLKNLAAEVQDISGKLPTLHIREGNRRDELFALLEEQPEISLLVLGASTANRGPGPLTAALTGKDLGKLHIPLVLVPDSMTEEKIDSVT